jgi:hypothetical protein
VHDDRSEVAFHDAHLDHLRGAIRSDHHHHAFVDVVEPNWVGIGVKDVLIIYAMFRALGAMISSDATAASYLASPFASKTPCGPKRTRMPMPRYRDQMLACCGTPGSAHRRFHRSDRLAGRDYTGL